MGLAVTRRLVQFRRLMRCVFLVTIFATGLENRVEDTSRQSCWRDYAAHLEKQYMLATFASVTTYFLRLGRAQARIFTSYLSSQCLTNESHRHCRSSEYPGNCVNGYPKIIHPVLRAREASESSETRSNATLGRGLQFTYHHRCLLAS